MGLMDRIQNMLPGRDDAPQQATQTEPTLDDDLKAIGKAHLDYTGSMPQKDPRSPSTEVSDLEIAGRDAQVRRVETDPQVGHTNSTVVRWNEAGYEFELSESGPYREAPFVRVCEPLAPDASPLADRKVMGKVDLEQDGTPKTMPSAGVFAGPEGKRLFDEAVTPMMQAVRGYSIEARQQLVARQQEQERKNQALADARTAKVDAARAEILANMSPLDEVAPARPEVDAPSVETERPSL